MHLFFNLSKDLGPRNSQVEKYSRRMDYHRVLLRENKLLRLSRPNEEKLKQ